MYPIPSVEKLVETRQCRHCGTDFPITDKDLEFYDKVSPTFAGVKYQIPAPTLCPDCRSQRRLSFRNERKLYKRKCDATGKDIISIYSPDKPFRVYEQEEWWSDHWNPMDYGREFDPTRPFFEQLQNLMSEVPRISLLNGYSENSEFCNHAWRQKNCYLSFAAGENNGCLYATYLRNCNDCMDCDNLQRCSLTYNSIDSEDAFDCQNISECLNVSNAYYCDWCRWCDNCIGCIGLTNQQYCIFNEQVSEWKFQNYKEKLFSDSSFHHAFLERFKQFRNRIPKRYVHGENTTNSTGDYLYNTENTWNSFHATLTKNVRYCVNVWWWEDFMDCSNAWGNAQNGTDCLGLEVHTCLWCNILFSNVIWWWSNNYYCDYFLWTNSNNFWCIGLRNASYCILNKQYKKEEYEELVPRIIEHMHDYGEWGEFFPSSMSPFGYNETVAQEFFPLSKEEALRDGWFRWNDYEIPFPKVEKIIPAAKLPNDIVQVSDDILNWAIECEVTGKPFRIIKQELEFYRKNWLPIPRIHPDQRHLDRMALRNPRSLFERNCNQCGERMITTYAPNRPETVYCEACYHQETI